MNYNNDASSKVPTRQLKWQVARYLGTSEDKILRVEIWANVLFVHVWGMRPTFVSRKGFNFFLEGVMTSGSYASPEAKRYGAAQKSAAAKVHAAVGFCLLPVVEKRPAPQSASPFLPNYVAA